MTTEQYDIKTNIKIGQQIFENLPNDIRPGWAGLVLSRFDDYIKDIPTSIFELYSIIDNKDRWKEAHEQFDKIRVLGLANKNFMPENYLRLAEIVAKVTYNASGQPAPFDSDSVNALTFTFNENELLIITNPQGINEFLTKLTITSADNILWKWYYYGRPQTSENLYYIEVGRQNNILSCKSNVNWYKEDFGT